MCAKNKQMISFAGVDANIVIVLGVNGLKTHDQIWTDYKSTYRERETRRGEKQNLHWYYIQTE